MKSSEARRVSVVVSTDAPNRNGNIILSRGCDFKSFLAYGSGPVLWNHDVNQIIARAISLNIEESRVTAVAEFPPPGIFAKSDEVYDLIHEGLVNSASVGYKYLKKRPDEERPDLNVVESWELLEFSFVSGLPANAEALILSTGPASDLKSRHQLNIDHRAENPDLYRRLRLEELQSIAFIQGLTTSEWCDYAAKISGARHARSS